MNACQRLGAFLGAVLLSIPLNAADERAVQEALRKGNLTVLQRVLRENPQAITNRSYAWDNVILRAAESGEADLLLLLGTNGVSVNKARGDWISSAGSAASPLHLAAGNLHAGAVAALLKVRARVDARDFRGSTPLLVAVETRNYPHAWTYGNNVAAEEIARRRMVIAALLLEAGADICATNREYSPSCPLDEARRNQANELVALMLTRWRPSAGHPAGSGLHLAAQSGLGEIVAQLATNAAGLEATNGRGFTPLQLAASSDADPGHAAAEILLQRGAVLDVLSAAALGKTRELESLLARDPARVKHADSLGRSALHWAARAGRTETAALLLRAGAAVNARDGEGQSPVASALAFRHTNVFELLLRHGSAIDATNRAGATPLHLAARTGNDRAVELLLAMRAQVLAVDVAGKTPLLLAIEANHLSTARLLLDAASRSDLKKQPAVLHAAVANGDKDFVALVIKRGADVNGPDASGKRPLHIASEHNNLPVMELLLAQGAQVNAADTNGNTALHLRVDSGDLYQEPAPAAGWLWRLRARAAAAPQMSNLVSRPAPLTNPPPRSITKFLLEHGANPLATNHQGRVPLHFIGVPTGSGQQIITASGDAGVGFDVRDIAGMTPLHLAVKDSKLDAVRSLLAQGAPVNATNAAGATPLHLVSNEPWNRRELIELLLKGGADLKLCDTNGRTPLHAAAQNWDHESLLDGKWSHSLLIAAGADVNARDRLGRTPLHLMLQAGKWPWSDLDARIHLLTEAGADVNARDQEGKTPLHYFAALTDTLFFLRGAPEALITGKTEIDAVDKKGETPLHLAARAGNADLFELLVAKGANPARTNHAGVTPAYLHAGGGQRPLMARPDQARPDIFAAARTGALAQVQQWLATDPHFANVTNRSGETPLQLAAVGDHSNVVAALLQAGANADGGTAIVIGRTDLLAQAVASSPSIVTQAWRGRPLLHYAAERNQTSAIEILVRAGADLHGRDYRGHTIMHGPYARTNEFLIGFLRAMGAQPSVFDAVSLDNTQLLATAFTNAAAGLKTDYIGRSALHAAVTEGKHRSADFLLGMGADPNATDHRGNTPLHSATRANCSACIRKLFENGARLEASSSNGCTALHYAAGAGAVEALETLLELGGNANVSARSARNLPGLFSRGLCGETPLHIAAVFGHTNVMERLLAGRADINATNDLGQTALDLVAKEPAGRFPGFVSGEGRDWWRLLELPPVLRPRLRPDVRHFLISHGAQSQE